MWVISFSPQYITSILLFVELLGFSRWESINEPFTDCEIDFYNWETAENVCISERSKNQTALYCMFAAHLKEVSWSFWIKVTESHKSWMAGTTGCRLLQPPTPSSAATSTKSDQPWLCLAWVLKNLQGWSLHGLSGNRFLCCASLPMKKCCPLCNAKVIIHGFYLFSILC